MAYAVWTDITDELNYLTPENNNVKFGRDGRFNKDYITARIAESDALIDGLLRSKGYAVPITDTSDVVILKRISVLLTAAKIARLVNDGESYNDVDMYKLQAAEYIDDIKLGNIELVSQPKSVVSVGSNTNISSCLDIGGSAEQSGRAGRVVPGEAGTTLTVDTLLNTMRDFTDPQELQAREYLGISGSGQVQSNWAETDVSAADYIRNKPTIPAAQVNSDWSATSGIAQILNKPTIPDAVVANPSDNASNVLSKIKVGSTTYSIAASGEDNVQSDWNETDTNADDFIKNKPTIPAAQVSSDWNASSGIAQILNKPTIPAAVTANPSDNASSALSKIKIGSTTYSVAAGGEANVQANWTETDTTADSYIQNKPTIPAAQVNSDWLSTSGITQILNKPPRRITFAAQDGDIR